jgi:hypothetical protein
MPSIIIFYPFSPSKTDFFFKIMYTNSVLISQEKYYVTATENID